MLIDLESLLQAFADHGLRGATVLDSKGMARILHTEDEMPIFYGLRAIMEPEHRSSKTIFMVLRDEQVDIAMRKGGISPREKITLERFEVIRHR